MKLRRGRSRGSRRRGRAVCASRPTCTPYTAGATGLDATMPPWVQEGGSRCLGRAAPRSRDPRNTRRGRCDTHRQLGELAAGPPDRRTAILLSGLPHSGTEASDGKTLAQVARRRGNAPEDTAIDLVIEDKQPGRHRLPMMSEPDVRQNVALPSARFGSDADP